VIQLFNAVKTQQKEIKNKLDEAGSLEVKRDEVLKNIDKRTFLDVLMGEKSEPMVETIKNNADTKANWNVLRDDFMIGAKMKDWDKTLEDESENEMEQEVE